jgi:predicted nucleotidyltransferase
MMTLDELRASKREAILAIARRHGVTDVRVFGSFARGDARPGSDLDLLIQAGAETTPFFPGGLLADLEDALGMRLDVVEEPALDPLLRDEVLREAIAL